MSPLIGAFGWLVAEAVSLQVAVPGSSGVVAVPAPSPWCGCGEVWSV